jgi:hypothetical protein
LLKSDGFDEIEGQWEVAWSPLDCSAATPPVRVSSAGTIAVVGGGLTGIETVTELAETYPDRMVLLVTSGGRRVRC